MDPKNSRNAPGGSEVSGFVSFSKKFRENFCMPLFPTLLSSHLLVFTSQFQSRIGGQRKEAALERQGVSDGPGAAWNQLIL